MLNYDIAIVGGSIVGTTLAAALKNSGLNIVIIESQPLEVVAARKQAYAISLMSARILQGIGVWPKIHPNMGKFSHIRLSDTDYQRVVKFEPQDLGTEYLGYVGEHNTLLHNLQQFLQGCKTLTWLSPAQVVKVEYLDTHAEVEVVIEGVTKHLKTKVVVGTDGAKSPIREAAHISTRGWKYWQSCVAFTIKHTAVTNCTAFERFWPTGPMGVLPLPGNRCQIVWTMPHKEAKMLHEMPEKEFLQQLESRIKGLLGDIQLVGERRLFPIQLMQSEFYVKHRLALAGDAAHCCHPVGGQGLNQGIRDAAALGEILQQAYSKGEDIGSLQVLQRYQRWRRWENLIILAFTDFLDRLFSNHFLPIILLRRFGLILMQLIPPLRIFALQLMTGLKGRIPNLSS